MMLSFLKVSLKTLLNIISDRGCDLWRWFVRVVSVVVFFLSFLFSSMVLGLVFLINRAILYFFSLLMKSAEHLSCKLKKKSSRFGKC